MILILLFIIQTALFLSVKLNIFPELFYFPWLITQGHIPYKDFFDHHGFFLYYLLAPFSLDTSLSTLKVVSYCVSSTTFLYTFLVLKKYSNGIQLFIGGLLYISLQFFVTGANMWYETFIALCYAIILYLVNSTVDRKYIFLGILIAIVSMIKPTSAIILIPVLIFERDFRIPVISALAWIPAGIYFYIQNALPVLVDNMFAFNSFYGNYMLKERVFFMDKMFLLKLIFGFVIASGYMFFYRKSKQLFITTIFFVFSLIHIVPRFEYTNLVPVIPFYILILILPLKYIKSLSAKNIYTIFLVIILVIVTKKIIQVVPWMLTRKTYVENSYMCDVYQRTLIKEENSSFYVFANNPELYYLTGKSIKLHHPLVFPWYQEYFPQLEQRIISDVNAENINYILIPTILDARYVSLKATRTFIDQKFYLSKKHIPCLSVARSV